MDVEERGVEKIIKAAMERGEFDNLPGKGKPLDLNENPFEDPAMALVNHVLKNAGFAPAWIEDRREVGERLEQARAALRRSWTWQGTALVHGVSTVVVLDVWQRAEADFRAEVEQINRQVLNHNLKAPSPLVHLRPVDADEEVARAKRVDLTP